MACAAWERGHKEDRSKENKQIEPNEVAWSEAPE